MEATLWILGVVLAIIAFAAFAARRRWIYSGSRKPESSDSGAFGELLDAFHPSHSFVAEELNRERPSFEGSAPRFESIASDEIHYVDPGGVTTSPLRD